MEANEGCHVGVQDKSAQASTNHRLSSIASYQDISRDFPSKRLRYHLQNPDGSAEEQKETWDSNLGPLFKVPFWRVILDEAHNIKNKDSQSRSIIPERQGTNSSIDSI